ncbi:MAG: endonuclease/exonuclease/phosphatase family protein [Chloroflexi bacterium]|nr:endonuclease/exonuclease/phosphatase family protein [Chloroflexota bacterium]
MTTIVSWNVAQRSEPWAQLLAMDADVALLQEAAAPPEGVRYRVWHSNVPFHTPGPEGYRPVKWRAAVVRLSNRVKVDWIEAKPLVDAEWGEFAVTRPGTLEAAWVTPPLGEPFIVCSMYSQWTRPLKGAGEWIMADNSAHRLISDLSGLIGRQRGHRIIAAGDLNIFHGFGDGGSKYWEARYRTVFDRMTAIGLEFMGPQAPNGRQAEPRGYGEPADSKNVPTYHTNRQSPATAQNQLDYVFASRGFHERVTVRALNNPEDWGPSDHCRVLIEVSEG